MVPSKQKRKRKSCKEVYIYYMEKEFIETKRKEKKCTVHEDRGYGYTVWLV